VRLGGGPAVNVRLPDSRRVDVADIARTEAVYANRPVLTRQSSAANASERDRHRLGGFFGFLQGLFQAFVAGDEHAHAPFAGNFRFAKQP